MPGVSKPEQPICGLFDQAWDRGRRVQGSITARLAQDAIPKAQKMDGGHPTQKPLECMKRPIENNSSPGQAVYDPFVGSGTTIIAAEMTGRACHAIELSPAYIDVAVTRLILNDLICPLSAAAWRGKE
jgi:DNA modification methylase